MTPEEFERIVVEEFPNAIPEKFSALIKNTALLVEDEPSEEERREEGLAENETLLGLYRGIPATARGDLYGIGGTVPDTITLYRLPIEAEAAEELRHAEKLTNARMSYEQCVRKVVRETIWHETAHHFGYDEDQIRDRENRQNGNIEE